MMRPEIKALHDWNREYALNHQRGEISVLKYVGLSLIKSGAIRDAYKDQDGYWIHLSDGWHIKDYFSDHIIHEDTVPELRKVIRRIYKPAPAAV